MGTMSNLENYSRAELEDAVKRMRGERCRTHAALLLEMNEARNLKTDGERNAVMTVLTRLMDEAGFGTFAIA
jgi:hypothetical protein